MDSRPIGIFDSGVGGLTVVKEVLNKLPGEEIIYFGDTARVPYGSKSRDTICKYSKQITDFLVSRGVKLIIVACNTICSNSYDYLAESCPIPIIEVISPGADACLDVTINNIVGVIGTEATIRSGMYEKVLKDKRPEIKVYSKACPLFVPLAEEGWTKNEVAQMTTEIYLQELINKDIDSLILACTHYPLLIESIKKTAGKIQVINPASAVADKTMRFLIDNNMLNSKETPTHTFYVSDNSDKFRRVCSVVLGKTYEAVKIDIDKVV